MQNLDVSMAVIAQITIFTIPIVIADSCFSSRQNLEVSDL